MRKETYFDIEENLADTGMFVDLFFNNIKDKEWVKIISHQLDLFEIINSYAPAKTIILHSAFFKDITSCIDERLLTLLAHLYFETFLNKIIEKRLKNPNNITKYNFKAKLDILFSTGIINQNMYQNISFLNKTRNCFAHNLNYNLELFDFKLSPLLKKHYKNNPYKKKSYRRKFFMVLYRLFLLQIGFEVGDNYREVYLLNAQN